MQVFFSKLLHLIFWEIPFARRWTFNTENRAGLVALRAQDDRDVNRLILFSFTYSLCAKGKTNVETIFKFCLRMFWNLRVIKTAGKCVENVAASDQSNQYHCSCNESFRLNANYFVVVDQTLSSESLNRRWSKRINYIQLQVVHIWFVLHYSSNEQMTTIVTILQ